MLFRSTNPGAIINATLPCMLPSSSHLLRSLPSRSRCAPPASCYSLIALWAAKTDIAQARGLDKVVVLSNLCFAAPLAVFGAEISRTPMTSCNCAFLHALALFITYFVGVVDCNGLELATKIQVQWSGLLFGVMMFAFSAMLTVPALPTKLHDRFLWALLLREPSFGGGGWILAASALAGGRAESRSWLITVGRLLIAVAAIFYGVEHFLHPLGMPGSLPEKVMPRRFRGEWSSTISLARFSWCAGGHSGGEEDAMAATYLGSWIFLLVLFVYGPILIASLFDPSTDVKVEGLNYFFDTLFFAGAILALASATPRTD